MEAHGSALSASRHIATLVVLALAVLSQDGMAQGEKKATDKEAAKAEKLLDRAEAMATRGSYRSAQAAYRKIAERYPASAAAKVARRRANTNAFLGYRELTRSGAASNRVDVVIMGDGYTLQHQRSFDRTARVVPRAFERNRTFGEYYDYLRFVRANVVSAADGIDGLGRKADTALGAFLRDEKRSFMDVDHGKVAAMLDELPEHDHLAVVFVRAGEHGLGAHGIAVVGGRDEKALIHEWGHAFAGLAEEHSDPERVRAAQPDPANISTTADPKQVPWAHWLAAKARGVGVYQGGDGKIQGAWKPMAAGCLMDQGEFFCPPCREKVVLRIYDFVDPIESCEPAAHESSESRKPDREEEPPLEIKQPPGLRAEGHASGVPRPRGRVVPLPDQGGAGGDGHEGLHRRALQTAQAAGARG